MSPNELPERDFFQLSYGEKHYRITLQGLPVIDERLELRIRAAVMHALNEYHEENFNLRKECAKQQQLVYTLAARYPDMAKDAAFLTFVSTGQVKLYG